MTNRVVETDPVVGPRDRESYFLAAYSLLGEHGYQALTVPALCDRVGVTKGSFYHHFVDLPEFVAAFARRWQGWLEGVFAGYYAETDLPARLELMTNSHIPTMVGAEPAIRAWGRTEPVIAQAVREIDAQGRALGEELFTALVGDAETGEMLSRMATSALIGMQQRQQPMDADLLVRLLAEWARRCLHLEIEELNHQGRRCVRVLGPTGVPVPRFRRPAELPAAGPDSGAAFDAAVEAAVARLSPAADRGRTAYFQAARELLVERGSVGVTVAALCERLGVTKGSFHHHFTTMSGFIGALAEQWESSYDAVLQAWADEPDPARRWEAIYQTALSMPHPAEAAWRAWSWSNPVVAAAMARLEARGEDFVVQILVDQGETTAAAHVLAKFGMGLVVGLQLHDPPLDTETHALTALEWLRRCARVEADLVLIDGIPQARVRTRSSPPAGASAPSTQPRASPTR